MRKVDQHDHLRQRNSLLRLAIITSLLSKASGLALQGLAIPLVYRTLGQQAYEIYLLMTAVLSTIALAQMGAGPGLTLGIATASAAMNRDQESQLFNAALRLTTVAALIGSVILLAVLHWVPPGVLFGESFVNERPTILDVADVCVIVVMFQIVAGVVDSALAGYQQQMFTNIGSMFANLVSTGMLIWVCQSSPTINNVILVIYGVPAVSRLANLVNLYRRKPYLLQAVLRSCRGSYGMLLNVGLAFWAIQIGGIIEQHGGTYVMAHLSTPKDTDLFAVVYRAMSLVGSVSLIVTQPLWPAFTDAIAHKDIGWIRRSYKRIQLVLNAFSIGVAVATVILGPSAFRYFVHIDTAESRPMFLLFGLYFVTNVWTHFYYVVLMGMGGIWRIAMVALSENVLLLIFSVALVPRWGPAGMVASYLLASITLPAWLLPQLMKRALVRLNESIASPLDRGVSMVTK